MEAVEATALTTSITRARRTPSCRFSTITFSSSPCATSSQVKRSRSTTNRHYIPTISVVSAARSRVAARLTSNRSQSRQCETELRSTSFFRIEIHSPAVLLDHLAHKREAQTGRFFVLLLSFTNYTIELVPHALLRLSGNSETTI